MKTETAITMGVRMPRTVPLPISLQPRVGEVVLGPAARPDEGDPADREGGADRRDEGVDPDAHDDQGVRQADDDPDGQAAAEDEHGRPPRMSAHWTASPESASVDMIERSTPPETRTIVWTHAMVR